MFEALPKEEKILAATGFAVMASIFAISFVLPVFLGVVHDPVRPALKASPSVGACQNQ
jgi:hypothetical protein